jgi:phosphonate transport system ATP-binding protein
MLVAEVDAFLVDEPLSALDPTLALRSLAVLQDAARERGATLICSLHQVELAHASFPRLVGLREGRIVFDLPRARVDAAMLKALYASSQEASPNVAVSRDDERIEVERIADGARL